MAHELLMTILLVVAAISAFLGWLVWRHYAERRSHVLDYEGHRRSPPPSTTCPSCRRRNYGRRAITDHQCPSCGLQYG